MRKITVGAIQPGDIGIPRELDCLSDTYRADIDEIIRGRVKPQLDVTLRLLEEAGQAGCGIVTTSEDICGLSPYLIDSSERVSFRTLTERATDIAEESLSGIAHRYGMYIIGCYFKRIGEDCYNIASVFDRTGNITGEYRKTHIPANELWQLKPGDRLNVIELDFGVIAVSICYDMMFPEAVAVQAIKGAEIIFHPTGGYGWYDAIGEATLKTRANDNDVYIVTAKNYIFNHAGKSGIIDFWGQTLAEAGFYENVTVYKEIDLDIPKEQPEWFYPSQMSGVKKLKERRAIERRPELYQPLFEKRCDRLTAPGHEKRLVLTERVRRGECRWS